MTRAKGTPNKPKEILDERLAKLAAIVVDPNQDAETQAAASKALATALTPAPPTAPWPGYMDCLCGNLFDNVGVCANCRAYLDRCKATYQAMRKAEPAFDEAAFLRELDELERGL